MWGGVWCSINPTTLELRLLSWWLTSPSGPRPGWPLATGYWAQLRQPARTQSGDAHHPDRPQPVSRPLESSRGTEQTADEGAGTISAWLTEWASRAQVARARWGDRKMKVGLSRPGKYRPGPNLPLEDLNTDSNRYRFSSMGESQTTEKFSPWHTFNFLSWMWM